jgi:adenosylhomocysteine nucleosidase
MGLEIGVICATAEERDALDHTFGLARGGADGPFGVVEGRAGPHRLHVAQGGIGKAAAAGLTAHLLSRPASLDLVVFCGVAGGMSPDLQPGDLVIGRETATHDYGAFRDGRLDWFPAGAIPIGPAPAPHYRAATETTPALERTIARLSAAPDAPRIMLGRIISGDLFLNCRVRRDELHAAWGADAIDMESAAVADMAARFGKPILILRTISDRACEESHLTYAQIADAAARNSAAFLQAYLQEA